MSQASGGSFQFARNLGDNVTIQLPVNSVAVYYHGFQLSSGSLYETCLDCDSQKIQDFFDAHNESPSSDPTILFSKVNLDPDVTHTLEVFNVGDKRFNSTGVITLDSLTVTIRDEVGVSSTSTSTSASTTASSNSAPTFTLMLGVNGDDSGSSPLESLAVTSATSATTSEAASSSGTDGSSQKSTSGGGSFAQTIRAHPWGLAGIIIAVLFVVFTTLFALMYFMRRRKRRRTAPTSIEGHWATRFFGEKGANRKEWVGPEGKEMHEVKTPNSGRFGQSGRDKAFPRPLVLAQRQAESPTFPPYPSPNANSVQQAARRETMPSAPSYLAYDMPRTTPRLIHNDLPSITVSGPHVPEVSRSPSVNSVSVVPQNTQTSSSEPVRFQSESQMVYQYTSTDMQQQPSIRNTSGRSRDPTAAASRASGVWEEMKSFTPPDPVSPFIPPALMMKTVRFTEDIAPGPSGDTSFVAPQQPGNVYTGTGYGGPGLGDAGANLELDARVNPYVAEAQRRVQGRATGYGNGVAPATYGFDHPNSPQAFGTPQPQTQLQYQRQQQQYSSYGGVSANGAYQVAERS